MTHRSFLWYGPAERGNLECWTGGVQGDIPQGRWVCCTCCPVPVRNSYNNIILILRKGMMRCCLSNPCCSFWVPLDQPEPGFWVDLNQFLDRSNISCCDFYFYLLFNPTKNLAAFSISLRQAGCPFFCLTFSILVATAVCPPGTARRAQAHTGRHNLVTVLLLSEHSSIDDLFMLQPYQSTGFTLQTPPLSRFHLVSVMFLAALLALAPLMASIGIPLHNTSSVFCSTLLSEHQPSWNRQMDEVYRDP